MAIFHLTAQVISRATGRSAVASAAYRSASRLADERLGRAHDFSAKADLIHSEILLPEGAPERLLDRATLWNEVEAAEKRKDAQLAREVELALPHELADAEATLLARTFVQEAFVDLGMVADLNVHKPVDECHQAKPHAHVMLTMRQVGPSGFGAKVRGWNDRELLGRWRELLAVRTNQALARAGHAERVDHRSYAAQGIGLEPQNKIGPAGARRHVRDESAERASEHHDIARRNGERILAEPGLLLAALTRQQSTFTRADLARLVHRHSDGAEQFAAVMAKVEASPGLIRLGKDKHGRERLTTHEMLSIERRMERSASDLHARRGHGVAAMTLERRMAAAAQGGLRLGEEQQAALRHLLGKRDLAFIVGYAGTGKSTMLRVAREAWEADGYRVRGAALAGIAAEGLQGGSGIVSRTLASWEHAWQRGREELTRRDVLVVDEAGMVGSRQLEGVLARARAAGAKVVLVGDPEQLQAIEAGAAFRALSERFGWAELRTVRRQRAEWMQDATRELATGRTGAALARYDAAGMVHASPTREAAMERLIAQWDHDRLEEPGRSQLILAYTRADVAALNELARERMRASGSLGEEITMQTERGGRVFAVGERVMFLRNERGLGVKNGSLGVLRGVRGGTLTIQLDDGARLGGGMLVTVDPRQYAALEHGYASTVHKSQGVTMDRTQVMAGHAFDRHASYVALSRHGERVDLHYGRDDFKDGHALTARLGRERAKDTTLDYQREPDRRRELDDATRRSIRVLAERLRSKPPRPERAARDQLSAAIRAVAQRLGREQDSGRGR